MSLTSPQRVYSLEFSSLLPIFILRYSYSWMYIRKLSEALHVMTHLFGLSLYKMSNYFPPPHICLIIKMSCRPTIMKSCSVELLSDVLSPFPNSRILLSEKSNNPNFQINSNH